MLNEPLLAFTFTADLITRGICIYFLALFRFCTITVKSKSCDRKFHVSKQINIIWSYLICSLKNWYSIIDKENYVGTFWINTISCSAMKQKYIQDNHNNIYIDLYQKNIFFKKEYRVFLTIFHPFCWVKTIINLIIILESAVYTWKKDRKYTSPFYYVQICCFRLFVILCSIGSTY